MKLYITLTLVFISLFFNNVYAISPEASACNQAFAKGDLKAALAQSTKLPNTNQSDKDVLLCQGRVLSASGDLNAALAAFKLADELSADAFDKTIVALLTGHAYASAKQSDSAIASYQQAIALAISAKNQSFEFMAQNSIGDIYFKAKQYPLALAAYLSSNKLVSNDNERGESNERVALTYHHMNQHDLALEYQIKAFLMLSSVGTLDQYAHSGIELGRYYTLEKSYVSAENILNKIIKLAKEQGGAYYEAQASYMLAKVKVLTGDKAAAQALLEHAKLIAKNTHDNALAEEIDQEMQH